MGPSGISADDARAAMPRGNAMLDHWVGVVLERADGGIAHAAGQGESSCVVDLEVPSEEYQATTSRLVAFDLTSRGFTIVPATSPHTLYVAWL